MKTLCIAIPKDFNKEGPFIKAQINGLQPSFILHHGYRPYKDLFLGTIFKFPLNIGVIRKAISFVFPKVYYRYYQDAVRNYLLTNKIEVVLAEYGLVGANLTEPCISLGIKLVTHFHGFDAYHKPTLKKYYSKYQKMLNYATVIAVSDHMRIQLINLGSHNVRTIPYGVNTAKFYPNTNTYKLYDFIFVGNFVYKKNPMALIQSFRYVVNRYPDAYLLLVGDGYLLKRCMRLVAKLGLKDSVAFTWAIDHEAVLHYLSMSRCYVQHSVTASDGDSEGMPNSILEAASCGLPVVSTFHAGISEEVITGITGYLCTEHDTVTMANNMHNILSNPKAAKDMGLRGRTHMINNFNITNQIDKLRKVIYEDHI